MITKKYILSIILALGLFSFFAYEGYTRNVKEEKILTISTNSWIGYAPLFYANVEGDLKANKMKLVTAVSLAESVDMFESGQSDMITTTQHEYLMLKKSMDELVPVILLDRSNGGDIILANKSLEDLKRADKIVVYLEIDSINADILKMFVNKQNLDMKKMKFINKDQVQIANLPFYKDRATIIVTYNPYDMKLTPKGYKILASTKDLNTIAVIDALCTKKSTYMHYPQRIKTLKLIIDKYITKMQNNPKESYEVLKSFLGDISYEEYLESLQVIEWINHPSNDILQVTEEVGYEKGFILP